MAGLDREVPVRRRRIRLRSHMVILERVETIAEPAHDFQVKPSNNKRIWRQISTPFGDIPFWLAIAAGAVIWSRSSAAGRW